MWVSSDVSDIEIVHFLNGVRTLPHHSIWILSWRCRFSPFSLSTLSLTLTTVHLSVLFLVFAIINVCCCKKGKLCYYPAMCMDVFFFSAFTAAVAAAVGSLHTLCETVCVCVWTYLWIGLCAKATFQIVGYKEDRMTEKNTLILLEEWVFYGNACFPIILSMSK